MIKRAKTYVFALFVYLYNMIEENKKNIIACDKCSWSWDEADTEPHDMYVCHKCGNDNSEKYTEKKDKLKESIKLKVNKGLRRFT